jgi:transcription initiation factor IIE alpha subunit
MKYDKKVHSVIPKPATSLAEKIGLDEVKLNITLSDDTKATIDDMKETMQIETQKTRMVLIVLGTLNAVSFLLGKYVF